MCYGNDMKDKNVDEKLIKRGEFWRRFESKIPGFCHGVDVVFALLGCYAAYVGIRLLAFGPAV